MPVSNCKAAVLVLVHPGYFISPLPAISGEHSPICHPGRHPLEDWQLLMGKRKDYQNKVMKWSPPGRRKRGRPKATWAEGIRGLMGEKGLIEEDWKDRDKWKKKIIVKWVQEDVETSNSLLNK